MSALPRTIGRDAYRAMRQHERNAACREDAGLPQHPANGWIDCPTCEGQGEVNVVWTHEDRYTCDACTRCGGDGNFMDGHEDPLRALQRVRNARSWLGSFAGVFAKRNAVFSLRYKLARQRAMQPVTLPLVRAHVAARIAA